MSESNPQNLDPITKTPGAHPVGTGSGAAGGAAAGAALGWLDLPAYRLGYNPRASTGGTFDAAEGQMAQDWSAVKGTSRLTREQARLAARGAWDRVTR